MKEVIMRLAILTLAVLFAASPAHAWGAKKHVEKHSINILVRRLQAIETGTSDPEIEESARKCSYLLDAWRARLKNVKEKDEIQLDSTDEQGLILRAYGLAAKAEAKAAFWREVWEAPSKWLWSKIKATVYHYLPLMPIAVWVWMSRKRLKRALFQYDRGVDQLPQEDRLKFKGPDLEREHAKRKAGG